MNQIDDTDLLVKVGKKQFMLFEMNDLDGGLPEVAAAHESRAAIYDGAKALEARLLEIRSSRMLTDHERAALRVKAFDQFDGILDAAATSLRKIFTGNLARVREMAPAVPDSLTDDALSIDLQLLAVAESFDRERLSTLMDRVKEGQPFSVRVAEALVRVDLLARNLDREWINGELSAALRDLKNADALSALRQTRIAASRLGSTLSEVRRTSRLASAVARRAARSVEADERIVT